MSMFKKICALGMFALIPAVLVGCSCTDKNVCYTPPPPRPRPAPVVCDPCTAVAPITMTETAAVTSTAPYCTTNYCQIVPPGTTVYSDPPTVTVTSSGQVINSTPARYYPATGPSAPFNPAVTTVSTTNSVPRSSNVRTI